MAGGVDGLAQLHRNRARSRQSGEASELTAAKKRARRVMAEKLRVLGQPTGRIDGPAKVTGQAKYAYDVQPNGLLYGMILRSKWPAANVTKIDLTKAQAMPGVKAAILAGGENRIVRFYEQNSPRSRPRRNRSSARMRFAPSWSRQRRCLLSSTKRMRSRMAHPASSIWEISSLPSQKEQGQVDAAFAGAAAVAEADLSTPVQIHHPLETHGNTISVEGDQITAWASTQGIFSVRDGLAGNMQFPKSNVRVICDYMGGGFGAKFGPGVHGGLAAQLSKAAGAPVKLMLTRMDQGLAVGNRPSSRQHIKLAADKNGKLVAADCVNKGSPGIGGGGSTAGGGGGAVIALPYIYNFPAFRTEQYGIALNTGAASAFRAPGHPPASFGTESVMDDLAVKLDMDPVAFRLLNDTSDVRQREYKVGVRQIRLDGKNIASPGPVPARSRRASASPAAPGAAAARAPRRRSRSIPTAPWKSAAARRISAPARAPSSASWRPRRSASRPTR